MPPDPGEPRPSLSAPPQPDRPKGLLFASAMPWHVVQFLSHVRARWPDHDWTVCVKAHEADHLPADCPKVLLPRLRPPLVAWWRARRSQYAISVGCWTGAPGYGRLKALHLLTPARMRLVYNENGDSFALQREADPPWLRHVRWRMGWSNQPVRVSVLSLAAAAYGWTAGPVLGLVYLCGKHALWRAGLGPRAGA